MSALHYEAIPCVRVIVEGPHAAVLAVMTWATENGCYGLGIFRSAPVADEPGAWRWTEHYAPDEAERVIAKAKALGAWEKMS